jgi:peptidoglycan/LPS O-acetylase OafA/YrhL
VSNADESPAPPKERRHDLDALRAAAMLLGIVLHAALSFMPGMWPVHDRYENDAYAVFVSAVHGFRMPLFFLVSGYFTAMLWRRRGLRALVVHRFKRIFLPLALGLVTIIPLTNWSFKWAASAGEKTSGNGASTETRTVDIWSAATAGDTKAVERFLAEGANIDDPQPNVQTGPTPLTLATVYNHSETTALLLERGADVNARNKDGGTALHAAAFFGRAEIAELLLKNGADTEAVDKQGQRPADVLNVDAGIAVFFASMIQLELDEEELKSGRATIATALGAQGKGSDSGGPNAAAWIMKLFFAPVFHHLWFLWTLCWLAASFAIFAWISDRLGWKPAPAWLTQSPWRFLWLFPLTLIPQAMMGWTIPAFGPDTSAGWLPWPPILIYYAVFFGFGAAYYDGCDASGRVGRWWPALLPLALFAVFPFGLEMTYKTASDEQRLIRKLMADALQVCYVWMMSFGCMGLFRRMLNLENPKIRFVSDSSYWLYLAHLPLIVLAQGAVKDWNLPTALKMTLICVGTTAFLLLTYRYLVRYTWLGTLLNGPRQRPKPRTSEKDGDAEPL